MKFETINMGGYNLHLIKTNKFKTITIDVDFYNKIKKSLELQYNSSQNPNYDSDFLFMTDSQIRQEYQAFPL